jgi:hypothetical protein
MATFDDDLCFIMHDAFSLPVIYGSQKTRGILDVADHEIEDGTGRLLQIRRTALLIKSDSLDDLTIDATIKVDCDNRKIRDISLREDGKITELLLADV